MSNPIMQMFGGQMVPTGSNSLATLIAMMKSGGNPQIILNSMANQNPQIKEAMGLLQGKTPQDMENICRELCKQKGIDFDATLKQVQALMR